MTVRAVIGSEKRARSPSTFSDIARTLAQCAATLTALVALSLLVARFDAPLVLVALLGITGGIVLLLRPELATITAVFLLYSNLAVVASQDYGVPKLVAAASMLLFAIPLGQHLLLRREAVRLDAGFGLMMVLLAVWGLSALASIDSATSLQRLGVFVSEGVLLYVVVFNVIRNRATLWRVVGTMVATGALLGSLAAYQAVTGDYHQEFGGLARREVDLERAQRPASAERSGKLLTEDRARGPTNGPNRFAQILIVLIPLALVWHRSIRDRRARIAILIAGGCIVAGVLLTYSRGGLLNLVPIVLAFAMVGWVRWSWIVGAAVALAILAPLLAPRVTARLLSVGEAAAVLETGRTDTADGAIRGRLTEMMAAGQVFLDHPLLGVGPGLYTPLYSVEYQSRPEFQFREIQTPRRAHTLYFEMAAETGIVGLTAFLLFVGWILRALWWVRASHLREDPELAELATALAISVLAYLGTAVFLHLSFERYFWFLMVVAAATVAIGRRDRPQGARPAR